MDSNSGATMNSLKKHCLNSNINEPLVLFTTTTAPDVSDRHKELLLQSNTKFVTAKELAQILRVPISTIYSWTSNNKIPYLKIGKHLRFDLNKVVEYFEKRTKKDCPQQSVAVKGNKNIYSLKTKYTSDSHNREK